MKLNIKSIRIIFLLSWSLVHLFVQKRFLAFHKICQKYHKGFRATMTESVVGIFFSLKLFKLEIEEAKRKKPTKIPLELFREDSLHQRACFYARSVLCCFFFFLPTAATSFKKQCERPNWTDILCLIMAFKYWQNFLVHRRDSIKFMNLEVVFVVLYLRRSFSLVGFRFTPNKLLPHVKQQHQMDISLSLNRIYAQWINFNRQNGE